MKFLRKMFSGRQMGDQQEDQQSDEQSGEPEEGGPPQVQGVLILTRQHLNDSWGLLEQITAMQRSKGYRIAVNMISKAAATEHFDDEAFLHEKIRKEFAKLGGDNLIERTKVFPCQASGGNSGVYCIIFDRPMS
ncbi:hypothetical protein MELA_01558 [Candidatus Methylomirabilis lanthanidiphila]|uniref:Uncharacterized protein n=1 Tax=Candidatus Methylomirabilis lanthanidiphila TaxID=2211376 RepID=A0A564ZKK7_9BACT|nr:hypothetical protein [Candidatus Methylomirabilis lanthanidiphila]VUZ85182.1 hypothetical protein MELA_01558 [Candidatus Methylomirabilis lanthanidiphila]